MTFIISGSIDEVLFKDFCEFLADAETEETDVTIDINSAGGNSYDALAFVERMRVSPCAFRVRGFGEVCSAATLILAAGDSRYLSAKSMVMFHEDSSKVKGTVGEMEIEIKRLRRDEDRWAEMMAAFTGQPIQEVKRLHAKEKWLAAEECLAIGLIDKII